MGEITNVWLGKEIQAILIGIAKVAAQAGRGREFHEGATVVLKALETTFLPPDAYSVVSAWKRADICGVIRAQEAGLAAWNRGEDFSAGGQLVLEMMKRTFWLDEPPPIRQVVYPLAALPVACREVEP